MLQRIPRSLWFVLIGVVLAIAAYVFVSSVAPLLIPLLVGGVAFIGGFMLGRRTAGIGGGRRSAEQPIPARAQRAARAEQPKQAAAPAKADAAAKAEAPATAQPAKSGGKFEWESWSDGDAKADVEIPDEQAILARLEEKERGAPPQSPANDAQAALLERKRKLGLLDDQQSGS